MEEPTEGVSSWEKAQREVAVLTADGAMPATIEGGADRGAFLRVGQVLNAECGLREGDIVLEVQGKALSGMTRSDANDWLRMCAMRGGVVGFRVVETGHLTADLRQYLAMRFPKGSVDHELQNTIRDNVYLKTVPCTTRPPRDGEIDNVDYRFLTVAEFQRLNADGQLLESGVFEGNLYGTPKPVDHVRQFDSVAASNRNVDAQRDRLKEEELREALTPRDNDAYRLGMAPLFGDQQPATTSTQQHHQHANSNGNGHHPNHYHHTNGNGIHPPPPSGVDSLGPLPPNWEVAYSELGEKYFIDHNTGTTQWNDPRIDRRHQQRPSVSDSVTSHSSIESPLPEGWEKVDDGAYGTFYVDHINKRTQYERPTAASSSHNYPQYNGVNAPAPHNGNGFTPHPPYPLSNGVKGPPSQPDVMPARSATIKNASFTRDPSKLRGELLTTRLIKGPLGFGFTLIGNDAGSPVEEFLQIKSVIPNGPAYLDNILHMGDVLVYINDQCVLGMTQEEAIRLFQGVQVGETMTLQVCRGYPLLLDPSDEIVTQDAYTAATYTDTSTLRQSEMITVHIVKGNEGFGFTIADSLYGQRVKKILYPARCPGLCEGDILCEINRQNVRKMSHTDIVDVLRDCPVGQKAVILVQRNVSSHSNANDGRHPPPNVLPKPHMRHSESQPGSRPHSYHPAYDGKVNSDRRSKTPQPAFRYGEPPPTGYSQSLRQGPNVKPRSKTPGPQPPRPNKPNGYLPQQPTHEQQQFRQQHQQQQQQQQQLTQRVHGHDGIYENLPGRREQSKSPSTITATSATVVRSRAPVPSSGFASATPNYVPVSAYMDNNRWSQLTPTPMDRSYSSATTATALGFELVTVNLIRQPNGFGFRVVGGTEEGTSIVVGQIVPGGAADQDGRLRKQDEIIEIDGQNVLGGRHQGAVLLMQKAAQNGYVKLVIRRPVKEMPRSVSMPIGALAQSQPHPPPPPMPSLTYPYDVILNRSDSDGFGFVIISSVNRNGSTIGRIIEGSPAARCGRLQVGDRIIAVNGLDILHMHHGEIVNLIKDSGLSVTLTVGAPDEYSSHNTSFNNPPTLTMNTMSAMNTMNTMTTMNGGGSPTIALERQPSLTSMLDSLERVNTDRYTEFNEFNNISVSDPPSPDRLRLETPYQSYFSTYVPPKTDGTKPSASDQLFTVELPRGAKGFGFSIRGGREFDAMPLFVLRVAEGGPAHVDGRLQVGDQLVEINGVPTVDMTHEHGIQLIKSEQTVRLLVRRPPHAQFDEATRAELAAEHEANGSGWQAQHVRY